MNPLSRQPSHVSVLSWWSDSNPSLQNPATINLHAAAKPLLKLLYRRQALQIIEKNRRLPLTAELLDIYGSYLPWNYVSWSTKAAILSNITLRVRFGSRSDAYSVVESPVFLFIPEMLDSPDIPTRARASELLGRLILHTGVGVVLKLGLCSRLVSLLSDKSEVVVEQAAFALSGIAQSLDGAKEIAQASGWTLAPPLSGSTLPRIRELMATLVLNLEKHLYSESEVIKSSAHGPNQKLLILHEAIGPPLPITFIEDDAVTIDTTDGAESFTRPRAYSDPCLPGDTLRTARAGHHRKRRMSNDEKAVTAPRRFLVDVEETIRAVLEQEDTHGDLQITVADARPKLVTLRTATSDGFKSFDIRGTYMLSSLVHELALARDNHLKRIVLDEALLTENPVDRLSRMIKISPFPQTPKNRTGRVNPRIYVPHGEPAMAEYYRQVARDKPHMNLDVQDLPDKPDDSAFIKSLDNKPGILALAMKEVDGTSKGIPFVAPSARSNELYNWDSYFITLGLLVDGQVSLAQGMVDHLIFEIKHYGKILKSSHSSSLCLTQPPFLTDIALRVYNRLAHSDLAANRAWLKRAIQAAIKEYHTIWVAEPRMDPKTGLSRFRPDGLGIPPDTEATQFAHILEPYALKHELSIPEFSEKYNDGLLTEPELDQYFLHHRAMQESGHDIDSTSRFDERCADMGTIDLQALLYKYEVDIATVIREVFDDELEMEEDFVLVPFPPSVEGYAKPLSTCERSKARAQTSEEWFARAEWRKGVIDEYLWDKSKSTYFDYDTVREEQSSYESVTVFWALWAGCASEEQAWLLVTKSLKKFEVLGGLVPGTEQSWRKMSRRSTSNGPRDHPYGFHRPPHQIMAWVGLERYGYLEEAQRLAYRFLYMMTTAFVDYNDVLPAKVTKSIIIIVPP
ncbi:trehalase-domain-containing protein [Favolaschia claudopus]|uniref:Trehalase n=1 Tax=Favolaschia claudopus TaxID=2862362 RepID=A0AAW0AT40_9AGAR